MRLPRTIFDEDQEIFRDAFRRFADKELVPRYPSWEKAGQIDRDAWLKAGSGGFLCPTIPEEYGGAGVNRFFSAVIMEELAAMSLLGVFYPLHSDIVAPYILNYGSEAQKRHYLPKMATGEFVGAVAMTEPNAGSDLQNMRTTAIRKGDHFVVNGQKTFISNGSTADVIVLAVKTDRVRAEKALA